jgi:predicted phosphodiesterase
MRILLLSDLHLEMGAASQPSAVCADCGQKYGNAKANPGATLNMGPCQVCGRKALVTQARDFGLLRNDWDLKLPDPASYDVVCLPGDIHAHTHALDWAAKTFPNKEIIYTPGNHEFYNAHLHGISVELKRRVQSYPNIHLLDNTTVVLQGQDCQPVRFIGATLWTDFRLQGESMSAIGAAFHEAKNSMSDFSTIRFGSTGWMTPACSVKLFLVSAAYIRDELDMPFDGRTVVVTHHLPSKRAVAERFQNDILSAAFASNLDHLIERVEGCWVFGHTHTSVDIQIGSCRLVCNPRGYANRLKSCYENPDFRADFIIDTDDLTPAPRGRASP